MSRALSPVVVQGVACLAQLPQYILMNSCTWEYVSLGHLKTRYRKSTTGMVGDSRTYRHDELITAII